MRNSLFAICVTFIPLVSYGSVGGAVTEATGRAVGKASYRLSQSFGIEPEIILFIVIAIIVIAVMWSRTDEPEKIEPKLTKADTEHRYAQARKNIVKEAPAELYRITGNEYNDAEARKNKAKKARAEKKQAELDEILNVMPTRYSELKPIVVEVVDGYEFNGIKETATILTSQEQINTLLLEYSSDLADAYKSAVRKSILVHNPYFHLRRPEVAKKMRKIVDSCIEIGAGVIAQRMDIQR